MICYICDMRFAVHSTLVFP